MRRSESKGNRIIERLERLRDEGHLALHMWEDIGGGAVTAFQPPGRITECLSFNALGDLDARLIDQLATHPPTRDLALLSASILPRFRNGKPASMTPYMCFAHDQGFAGYLMDMTPTAPSPPRPVVFASGDIFTPEDPYDKRLILSRTDTPKNAYFQRIPCGRKLQPNDLTDFATEWLPRLQSRIEEDIDYSDNKRPIWCNEIVVAARPEHRTAIVVPVFQSQEGKPRQWMAEAAGAIAGLRHGKDTLPVVAYHVDGTKQGGFTYWGASRKEFMGRLLDAVGKLESSGVMDEKDKEDGALDALRDALSERGILNYRVDAPKAVRLKQLDELNAGLKDTPRARM